MMELFAIRHRATQNFLCVDQTKNYRGTTFWNGEECGRVPRLFINERAAKNCITMWAKGEAHNKYEGGFYGDEWVGLEYKDIGRKREDLEIVPMLLTEFEE